MSMTELHRQVRPCLFHAMLALIGVLLLLPFVWMVLCSFKPLAEMASSQWVPSSPVNNYAKVLSIREISFAGWYWNSLFVTASVTLLQVLTSSFAAFSFSRLEWPGRDRLFLLYMGTTMLPGLVMMIPNYQLMVTLRLTDSLLGLILPSSFTAFGTFLLRQFMLGLPKAIDEAAEIDGASKWQLFWEIILPLSRPGVISLAIFTFVGNYNSFFWPLVMLKSPHNYTLPVGLLFFNNSQGQEIPLLMAAAVMTMLPMVLVFLVFQKHLVKGIQAGAVKG